MSIYQKETNFKSDNSESMPIENDKGETAKLIPQIGAEGPVVPLSSSKLEPGTSNGGAPGEGQDALPSSTIPEVVESKGAAGRESQVALSSTKSPKSAAPNGRASAQDQPAPPSKGPKAKSAKGEAGTRAQVAPSTSDTAENNPPLNQGAEPDHGGCLEPLISPVSTSSAHKPDLDKSLGESSIDPIPTNPPSETGTPGHAAAESPVNAETAPPSESLTAPVEAPLSPPTVAPAVELFTSIVRCLLASTHLPKDAAELVAFWAISTWFQDTLQVLPCLILTGPAGDATDLLIILRTVCQEAALLAGFRRSHLRALYHGCRTSLIFEPNLDKRAADLLGNLTDRRFLFVEGNCLMGYFKSMAIYAGENPGTHKIRNSINIHIAPTNPPSAHLEWEMIKRVLVHLEQYRTESLDDHSDEWPWVSSGLSSETAAIADPLGSCILNAPELRQEMQALMKTQDRLRLCEKADTPEAIVVETIRSLSRDGREHAYAAEIAIEANWLLEGRGETVRMRPETVGHILKRLGLRTRPLVQNRHGLKFDKATVAAIEQLASAYGMEDIPAKIESLLDLQDTENK
jgi:hypothetical protein